MGMQQNKGWIFGYKLHIACSTGSLIVPLTADFTTANIPDNTMYENIASSLPVGVSYVVADEGYDARELYEFSRYRGFDLVCPIRRYRHTRGDRLKLVQFYRSELGQDLYS